MFDLDKAIIHALVRHALSEDVGTGDLTANLLSSEDESEAHIISREQAVVCGIPWAEAVFYEVDPQIQLEWLVAEGEEVGPGREWCSLQGMARPILTAERTALNFLQTLSGTATLTRRYVDQLKGTKTTLLDTRKTVPGLRYAQKYAVKIGGGHNHRMGLYDGILIKENHIKTVDCVATAIAQAREWYPNVEVVVEVENLEELKAALESKPDRVLCDNFSLDQLREAVAIASGAIPLEASGNLTLNNIAETAKTGVEYVSCGGLTKDIRAVDLSLIFIN